MPLDLPYEFPYGTNLFLNTGTLEKIGGTGKAHISWNFDNEWRNHDHFEWSVRSELDWQRLLCMATQLISSGTISGTLAPGAVMSFSANINGSLIVSSNAVANWLAGIWKAH